MLNLGSMRSRVAAVLAATMIATAAPATVVSAAPESPGTALSRYIRVLASNPRDFNSLIGAGRAALELGDVQTAAGGIGSTEAQVKSAEQTAQATLARYNAGFGSILDLITAQQDEANARVQRIQSFLDWYTALARLQFSTGFHDMIAATSSKK